MPVDAGEGFEALWSKLYPNSVAYFAQFNDGGLMRDMCRNTAYDVFKAITTADTWLEKMGRSDETA